ncbi:MAG: flagellar protein FlaG [Burkholderiales bacterium]|nr:flagellar protein FlaG [Burkholderiales bacterium]
MQVQALNSSLLQPSPASVDTGTSRAYVQPTETSTANELPPVQQVQAAGKNEPQPSVEDSVKKLNDMASNMNVSIQFSVDPDTKMQVVKVVDASTKEVIRQIPSEEVIDIAKAIDKFQGMLVRDKA